MSKRKFSRGNVDEVEEKRKHDIKRKRHMQDKKIMKPIERALRNKDYYGLVVATDDY